MEWNNGEDVAPENLYYESIHLNDCKKELKELD